MRKFNIKRTILQFFGFHPTKKLGEGWSYWEVTTLDNAIEELNEILKKLDEDINEAENNTTKKREVQNTDTR